MFKTYIDKKDTIASPPIPHLPINANRISMMKMDPHYVKPKEGTYQQNLTKENIINGLEGYRKLVTIEEKKMLNYIPLFKTWVKYYDTLKKEFRLGGVIIKNAYPVYIMLMNMKTKITWSVQLANNIIFIPEDKILENEVSIKSIIKKDTPKNKEDKQKEMLWKLYKNGELIRKKKN
jgi:c-di-AMP phosphodiesterase-like protein